MIEILLANDFGGSARLSYEPAGLEFHLTAPASNLSQTVSPRP
jgi:hypothetical protein